MAVPFGLLLDDHPDGCEPLRPLQELDLVLPKLDRETTFEPLVGEVRSSDSFPGPFTITTREIPAAAISATTSSMTGVSMIGRSSFGDRPADGKEARPEATRRDHAVPHRPKLRRAVGHWRVSALTLNATGSVVRIAKPVTARSARRSPVVSTSNVRSPLLTVCRSTVPRSPKWSTCSAKRWETRLVERMKPDVVQPLSVSASSSGRPGYLDVVDGEAAEVQVAVEHVLEPELYLLTGVRRKVGSRVPSTP